MFRHSLPALPYRAFFVFGAIVWLTIVVLSLGSRSDEMDTGGQGLSNTALRPAR